MTPRIEVLQEKLLIGKMINMSMTDNKVPELWKSFLPRLKEIQNIISSDLFSIEVYSSNYFDNFNPNSEFILDSRPHFSIMGKNYKKDDPNSQKEIWIPIQMKKL